VDALGELCAAPEIDVIVLARGGGSFEDLLPFSEERLVRAVASCPVPIVTAVGHEQDTPLCDLAADVRASTPTAAGRLVVPDATELANRLMRARAALGRGAIRALDRARERSSAAHERLRRAPLLLVERRRAAVEHAAGKLRALSPQATLDRGYAIVRTDDGVVRAAAALSEGTVVDVRVAEGAFGARVEDVRP
jgi:exodeoxyribonuclease VII large subunit